MTSADFRFHGELNVFLPPKQRAVIFSHFFKDRASIKDMIESLGVPHPEVDAISVNKEWVDFSYIVGDKDIIDVYPVSVAKAFAQTVFVRPPILSVPTFVLDVHLGKLAASLRMLGFDTLYRNDYDDQELAEISASQQRMLLTRDKGLLMRSLVTYGYYVRETNPERQVVEVLRRFDLSEKALPFGRCIKCNGLLESVDKESIFDQIPERTRTEIDEFHRCGECNQIYWQGSHAKRMQQFVEGVLDRKSEG
ncbi:MAG: Mut7-C RNAse domain-containing protein [Potamolinea sp.]